MPPLRDWSNRLSGFEMDISRSDYKHAKKEHLDFTEKLIRERMSSVYSHRFWRANNKFLSEFDANEPSTFILNLDANNLYGGMMENCKLLVNDFKNVNIDLNDILLTDDEDDDKDGKHKEARSNTVRKGKVCSPLFHDEALCQT